MSTTPNQKDLLAKKSDLEGVLKPDDNDVLHLPDVTITLAESGQFYLAGIDKKLLTLIGNTSGNAVTLDGDAGLTFTTSGGSSTITGITSSSGNSTSLAASQSMVSAKQDQLTAGTNITIQNNVISATGGGSNVTVTPIQNEGKQVATFSVDGTISTLYSGKTIYTGTTTPSASLGVNDDLYIKYINSLITTTFNDLTLTANTANQVPITDFSKYTHISFHLTNSGWSGSADVSEDIADIPDYPDSITVYEYNAFNSIGLSKYSDGIYIHLNGGMPNTVTQFIGSYTSYEPTNEYIKINNKWQEISIGGGATSLENLTDVNITTPTDGQGLVYNNTTQKWENGNVSSASSIDTLTDVDLTNLSNGQILKYNSTTQKWENANESGGGGGGTSNFTETSLFTGGVSGTTTFTLSDNFNNYDYIAIYYSNSDSTTNYQDIKLYPSSLLNAHIGDSVNILGLANDAWYYYFTVTSTTQLTYAKSNAGWITDIIGLKYGSNGGGGGGTGGGLTSTILLSTPITATGTYTLADSYTNYDLIGFRAGNGSNETDILLYTVKDISDAMGDSLTITNPVTNSWFNFTISGNSLVITGKTVNTIYSVIGYKISGSSGGGASLPNNYTITADSLKINNEAPSTGVAWTIEDDTDYFDSAAGITVSTRVYQKTNAVPALGGVYTIYASGNTWTTVMFTSTDATAVAYSDNADPFGSFTYLGYTWYFSGTDYALSGDHSSEVSGARYIGDFSQYDYSTKECCIEAAKYLIDHAGVSFEENNFTTISRPSTGYIIAGGGSAPDFSDATFKVTKQGNIYSKGNLLEDIFQKKSQELTSSQYKNLTLAEKSNGTIYFINDPVPEVKDPVQLIERVSAADSHITSSSYSTSWGSFENWKAFNNDSPNNLRDPQDNCWQGKQGYTNQWIQYQFDTSKYLTQIDLLCFSNYSGDWIGTVSIEGSNDGNNFINILETGQTYTLTAKIGPVEQGGDGTETYVTIPLDYSEKWTYIRLTFAESMCNNGTPSCYIDEIYVYGGSELDSNKKIYYMDTCYLDTNPTPISSHSYSTTEQKVGTWIDGRDMYEKTYYNATGPTQSNPITLDSSITTGNTDYFACPQYSYLVDGSYINGGSFLEVSLTSNGISANRNNAPAGLGTITELYTTVRYVKSQPRNVSLLHFEGDLTDECGVGWHIDGGPVISTEQAKFGSSSLKFTDGFVYSDITPVFKFGNNDFTIDAWLYPLAATRQAFFAIAPYNGGDYRLGIDMWQQGSSANQWMSSNGSGWNITNADGGGNGIGHITLSTNTWQHIALVRHETSFTLYINGQVAVTNNIGTAGVYWGSSDVFKLGTWGNNRYKYYGYIDEFRVANYAVWTDTFTPPTQPYT